MRYLVMIVVMMAGTAPALAAQDAVERYCREMASVAETIMDQRQQGRPAPEVIDTVTTGDPALDPALERLVLSVYENAPRHQSERMRREAAEEFSTVVYTQCRRAEGTVPGQEARR